MEMDLATRIANNPKYQELKAKRSSFGWILTAMMMIVYYGFIMLVAFNKEFLIQKMGSGVMTIEELAEFKVTQCVRRLIAQNMGNLRLQG